MICAILIILLLLKIIFDYQTPSYFPPTATDNKKTKKAKRKKDPNAPKRPQTAFFLYCADHRDALRAQFPDLRIGDIAKKLGAGWAECEGPKREKYESIANAQKEIYKKQMELYKSGQFNGGQNGNGANEQHQEGPSGQEINKSIPQSSTSFSEPQCLPSPTKKSRNNFEPQFNCPQNIVQNQPTSSAAAIITNPLNANYQMNGFNPNFNHNGAVISSGTIVTSQVAHHTLSQSTQNINEASPIIVQNLNSLPTTSSSSVIQGSGRVDYHQQSQQLVQNIVTSNANQPIQYQNEGDSFSSYDQTWSKQQ